MKTIVEKVKNSLLLKVILLLIIMMIIIGGIVYAVKEKPMIFQGRARESDPWEVMASLNLGSSFYGNEPQVGSNTSYMYWILASEAINSNKVYCTEHGMKLSNWVPFDAYYSYRIFSGQLPVMLEYEGHLKDVQTTAIRDRLWNSKNRMAYFASLVDDPINKSNGNTGTMEQFPIQSCIWKWLDNSDESNWNDTKQSIYNAAEAYDLYAKKGYLDPYGAQNKTNRTGVQKDHKNESAGWIYQTIESNIGEKDWEIGKDIKIIAPEIPGGPYIIEHKPVMVVGATSKQTGMYGEVVDVKVTLGEGKVRAGSIKLTGDAANTKTEFYVDGGDCIEVEVTMNNAVRILDTFITIESQLYDSTKGNFQNLLIVEGSYKYNKYTIETIVEKTPTLTFKKVDEEGNMLAGARFDIVIDNIKNAKIPKYGHYNYFENPGYEDKLSLLDVVIDEVVITDIELRTGNKITITITETKEANPTGGVKYKKIRGPVTIELTLEDNKWVNPKITLGDAKAEEIGVELKGNSVDIMLTNLNTDGLELEITKRNFTGDPKEEGALLDGAVFIIEFQDVISVEGNPANSANKYRDEWTVGEKKKGKINIERILIKEGATYFRVIIEEKEPPMGYEKIEGVLSFAIFKNSDGSYGYNLVEAFLSEWHKDIFDASAGDMKITDDNLLNIDIRNKSDGSLKLNLQKTNMSGEKPLEGKEFTLTIPGNVKTVENEMITGEFKKVFRTDAEGSIFLGSIVMKNESIPMQIIIEENEASGENGEKLLIVLDVERQGDKYVIKLDTDKTTADPKQFDQAEGKGWYLEGDMLVLNIKNEDDGEEGGPFELHILKTGIKEGQGTEPTNPTTPRTAAQNGKAGAYWWPIGCASAGPGHTCTVNCVPVATDIIYKWGDRGNWTYTGMMGASINHQGIDISATGTKAYRNTGDPNDLATAPYIIAAKGGTVSVLTNNDPYSTYPKMGNCIVINHGDGTNTQYAHLQNMYITSGTVSQGQVIGRMGNTSSGQITQAENTEPMFTHLHLNLNNGALVDPLPFLSVPDNAREMLSGNQGGLAPYWWRTGSPSTPPTTPTTPPSTGSGTGEEVPLDGVVFDVRIENVLKLKSDGTGTVENYTYTDKLITKNGGKLSLTEIYMHDTNQPMRITIKEAEKADGYELLRGEIVLVVTKDGDTYKIEIESCTMPDELIECIIDRNIINLNIKNEEEKEGYEFNLIKTDEAGKALAGIRFSVEISNVAKVNNEPIEQHEEGDGHDHTGEILEPNVYKNDQLITDGVGKISLTGIGIEDDTKPMVITIKEEEAPGYELIEGTIKIYVARQSNGYKVLNVNASGIDADKYKYNEGSNTVELTLKNKKKAAEILIIKTDESGEKLLSGVTFSMTFTNVKAIEGSAYSGGIITRTTNSKGEINIKGIEFTNPAVNATVRILEIEAKGGYKPSGGLETHTITPNGKIEVRVKNTYTPPNWELYKLNSQDRTVEVRGPAGKIPNKPGIDIKVTAPILGVKKGNVINPNSQLDFNLIVWEPWAKYCMINNVPAPPSPSTGHIANKYDIHTYDHTHCNCWTDKGGCCGSYWHYSCRWGYQVYGKQTGTITIKETMAPQGYKMIIGEIVLTITREGWKAPVTGGTSCGCNYREPDYSDSGWREYKYTITAEKDKTILDEEFKDFNVGKVVVVTVGAGSITGTKSDLFDEDTRNLKIDDDNIVEWNAFPEYWETDYYGNKSPNANVKFVAPVTVKDTTNSLLTWARSNSTWTPQSSSYTNETYYDTYYGTQYTGYKYRFVNQNTKRTYTIERTQTGTITVDGITTTITRTQKGTASAYLVNVVEYVNISTGATQYIINNGAYSPYSYYWYYYDYYQTKIVWDIQWEKNPDGTDKITYTRDTAPPPNGDLGVMNRTFEVFDIPIIRIGGQVWLDQEQPDPDYNKLIHEPNGIKEANELKVEGIRVRLYANPEGKIKETPLPNRN